MRFAPGFTASRPSPLLAGVAEARQVLEAPGADGAGQAQAAGATGRGLLAGRLAGLSAAEQERVVLDVVCGAAAAILGHDSAEAVGRGAVFRDLGFDSLTAVELRNHIKTATGLTLSPTLIFDHPTPAAIAAHIGLQFAESSDSE